MHAARVLAAAFLTTSAIGCAEQAADMEAEEEACAEYHVQICDPQEWATDRVCPIDVEYVRECVPDDEGTLGWSSCFCDGPEDEPEPEPEPEAECPTTPDGEIYEGVTCGPNVPDHCPCVPSGGDDGSGCQPKSTATCTAACEVLHDCAVEADWCTPLTDRGQWIEYCSSLPECDAFAEVVDSCECVPTWLTVGGAVPELTDACQ